MHGGGAGDQLFISLGAIKELVPIRKVTSFVLRVGLIYLSRDTLQS